jgi:hypothetical protein
MWNHRVILREAGHVPGNPKLKYPEYIAIHEVFYNKEGIPDSVTENAIDINGYGNLEEIKWTLERMLEALKKPILDYETLKEINKEKQDDFSKSNEEEK